VAISDFEWLKAKCGRSIKMEHRMGGHVFTHYRPCLGGIFYRRKGEDIWYCRGWGCGQPRKDHAMSVDIGKGLENMSASVIGLGMAIDSEGRVVVRIEWEVDSIDEGAAAIAKLARKEITGWNLSGDGSDQDDEEEGDEEDEEDAEEEEEDEADEEEADDDEDEEEEDEESEDEEEEADEEDGEEEEGDEEEEEDDEEDEEEEDEEDEEEEEDDAPKPTVKITKKLKSAKKLREVVQYLLTDAKMKSKKKIVRELEALKSKLPVLQRIQGLAARGAKAAELLEPKIKP